MKKITLLFIMLLPLAGARAQMTLEDFYQPGATWCEEKVTGRGHGTYTVDAHFEWRIADDTVINTTTYHKLRNMGATYGGIRISNDTVFFCRTDATNYFFNNPPLGTETILYNFNLAVGDTVEYARVRVKEVLSVQLTNGQWVPAFRFNNSTGDWVYGIGGYRGLFDAFIHNEGPYFLRTYTSTAAAYNTSYSYPVRMGEPDGSNGPFTPCFPTSVGEVLVDKGALNIYPNPIVESTFQFITQAPVERLIITDVAGKIVYTATSFAAGKHTIAAPQQPGIYLLRAITKDGRIETRKLVKQ